MWRLALLSALLVLELAACKHKGQAALKADPTVPATAHDQIVIVSPIVSSLKMNDPATLSSLIRGFYGVESGSWRWTATKFAVMLLPPKGAAENGATLEFKFSLPEVVANKIAPLTLSARINGFALPSQTYSKAGDFIYTAAIPKEAFSSGSGYVEFSTDKAMPPSAGDKRELALIAVSVALLPK
jgi:hypothetical protein